MTSWRCWPHFVSCSPEQAVSLCGVLGIVYTTFPRAEQVGADVQREGRGGTREREVAGRSGPGGAIDVYRCIY